MRLVTLCLGPTQLDQTNMLSAVGLGHSETLQPHTAKGSAGSSSGSQGTELQEANED